MTDPSPRDWTPSPRHIRAAWFMGVGAVLLFVIAFSIRPPVEGDAYEYAEIARNVLEHGEATQTHLRYPALINTQLPTPAGRRLNGNVGIYLIFQLLLGSSVWVILLPFLLAVLFLPRVSLAALGPLFGPGPALLGAAAFLVHPHLFWIFLHDPNVDLLLTTLMLATLWAFGRRHLVLTGLLLGLALLVKLSAAPLGMALFVAIAVHERHRLRERDAKRGVGLALLLVAPYLVHLMTLQFGGEGIPEYALHEILGITEVPATGAIADLAFHVVDDVATVRPTLLESLSILATSTYRYIFGSSWMFGRRAGLLEMVGVLLLPFLVVGIRAIRPRVDRLAITLFILGLVTFNALLIMSPESRFSAPLLPVTFAASFAGIKRVFGGGWGRRIAFAAFLLTVVPALVLSALRLSLDKGESSRRYDELTHLGDLLGDDPGVTLTMPFFSVSYFAGGLTVPVPLGSMKDILGLAHARGVKGLLLHRYRAGGCLPHDPLLPLTAETEHFCYYRLQHPPDELRAGIFAASTQLLDFEPLKRQLDFDPIDPLRSAESLAWASPEPATSWPLFLVGLALLVLLARWPRPVAGPAALTTVALLTSLGLLHPFLEADKGPPATLEEAAVNALLPADRPLAFTLLAVPGVTPSEAAAAMPRCPPPLAGRTCQTDADAVLVGVPNWEVLGVYPAMGDAEALTARVSLALDSEAQRLTDDGYEVFRLPRLILGLPH